MAIENDKIKDLFSSKFNSFEPDVPASIWGGIDQLLSQEPVAATEPTTSTESASSTGTSTTSAVKIALITIATIASIAIGVYFLTSSSDKDVEEPTKIEEKELIEDTPPLVEEIEEEDDAIQILERILPQSRAVVETKAEPATTEIEEVLTIIDSNAEDMLDVEDTEVETEVQETEEAEVLAPAPIIPQFFKEDVSLSLRTNIGVLSSKVNGLGGDLLFSRNDRSTTFIDALREENANYKLSHSLPISVGLIASKKLSDKFSIETGLVFTYLSSKVTSNSAIQIEEKQTFGYLGIPIYVNYEFYKLNKTKFYLSLGAMMQKDIFGKYKSQFATGENIINTDLPHDIIYSESAYLKKNISQSHWQFSTHLSVGATYPIYKKLHLYSLVGGAYYFDAKNEYRTIYSDRKFQLDVSLGLKLDF